MPAAPAVPAKSLLVLLEVTGVVGAGGACGGWKVMPVEEAAAGTAAELDDEPDKVVAF